MKRCVVFFVVAAVSAGATVALAADQVRKLSGQVLTGTLKSVGKNEVEIEKTVGGPEKVSIVDVEFVSYDSEPSLLKGARLSVANGGYENAIGMLGRIPPAEATKAEVKADIQFYKAYCEARLALGGGGKPDEAGKAMTTFLTANPNSYHAYTAIEMVADLLVKTRNYEAAQTYYGQLEAAAFPEYKMRAGVGKGRVLLAQNKFAEAQAEFEKVLAITGASGSLAKKQQFAASLGKAQCLAGQSKPDDGIKLIEEVIKGVSPEDTDLMAQAYVAQGKCYLQNPNAKKQALLAFLHVDTLYSGQPAAHAEALKQLDILWRDLGKPERALQAVQLLNDRYPAASAPQP